MKKYLISMFAICGILFLAPSVMASNKHDHKIDKQSSSIIDVNYVLEVETKVVNDYLNNSMFKKNVGPDKIKVYNENGELVFKGTLIEKEAIKHVYSANFLIETLGVQIYLIKDI